MRLASVILVIGFLAFVWLEPQQVLPDTPPNTQPTEQSHEPVKADLPPPNTARGEASPQETLASIRFVTLPDAFLPPSTEPVNDTDTSKTPREVQSEVQQDTPEPLLAELPPKPLPSQPAPLPSQIVPMTPNITTETTSPPARLLPKPLMLELKAEPKLAAFPENQMASPLVPIKPKVQPLDEPIMTTSAAEIPMVPLPKPLAKTNDAVATETPTVTMTASGQDRQHAMKQMDDADETLELELFWPDDKTDREKVAVILRQCFGLTSGYLLNNGKLYDIRDGKVKAANRNFYSPYLRSRQNIDATEKTHQANLQAQLGNGTPVQLFSKTGDSYIIGGLLNAAEADQLQGRVSGSYKISQGQLFIDDIRIKGQPISGRIALGNARCI